MPERYSGYSAMNRQTHTQIVNWSLKSRGNSSTICFFGWCACTLVVRVHVVVQAAELEHLRLHFFSCCARSYCVLCAARTDIRIYMNGNIAI